MPTVELHHRFIPALVCIVNHCDGLLPHGIPSAVSIPVITINPPAMRSPCTAIFTISLLPSPA
jgi:hypothetical protein